MKQAVYKYEVPFTAEPLVRMPEGADVLSVGMQGDRLVAWALVDPSAAMVSRKFRVAGTGHGVDADCCLRSFIGTVFDFPFVWHVFDLGEQR